MVTQNLFTQGLSQDIVTGSNHEAYRKCKAFFSESDVVAIKVTTSNGNEICALNKTAERTLNMQSHVYFDEARSSVAGNIEVIYSLDNLYQVYQRILSDKFSKGRLEDFIELKNRSYVVELNILNEGLRSLSLNALEHQKGKILQAEGEAAIQIAKQVSHDIRSPLSALTLLIGSLQSLPEDKRILVRSAVNRINDIANTLLTKSKKANNYDNVAIQNAHSQIALLTPLIDSIVSEKRIQFREKQGVEIECDIDQGYGLFVNINAAELKRTISNLVNNAVEAFSNETGKVIVAVRKYGERAIIIIQDNGKGIPEHILKKLGELGVSHGKEGTQSGSGLGVYHAKKAVEDSGGKFQMESREGSGTTITMSFNKVTAPSWFVEKLLLIPDMAVASLDDDISIHQIWKGRFESKNVSEFNIEHRTFTSGPEFKEWVLGKSTDAKLAQLYLVDYELLNQDFTGLDIIEELGIGSQAILVTSRYEEDKIRERCIRLGVRLIPKAMAGFVPIEITKPKQLFDGILLDDDSLVHSCWQVDANNKYKKLIGFYNADDFMNRVSEFDTSSKVYVDSNLGNGVKGEIISKKIHDLGFTEIYLCTGYQASEFQPMPWIKGIVGKDPFPNSEVEG